jgi:hypothetical protein
VELFQRLELLLAIASTVFSGSGTDTKKKFTKNNSYNKATLLNLEIN